MKIIFIYFFVIFFSLTANAQINHFIYLQTENRQPFYIKVNNKILSSSVSGYLIFPKLRNGNYKILFGFPKSSISEQSVNINVDNKDAGYIIKDLGDKGWALFNLQTYEIVKTGNKEQSEDKATPQQKQNDAFSNMLADAVNDSTIREKQIVKQDVQVAAKHEDTVSSVKPVAEVQLNQMQTNKDFTAPDPEVNNSLVSMITRKLKKKNKDGTDFIYIDETDGKKDTIRIFLPLEKAGKKNTETEEKDAVVKDSILKPSPPPPLPQESMVIKDEEKKQQMQQDTLVKIVTDTNKIVVPESKPVKSGTDCKALASEEDFFKLRKKMAAENNDDDMISIAKKIFKAKCFTTKDIKNLSTLFLKDEGKYNFFDAAYPFVSDSDTFSGLENQLSDPYYITRFKAMIRN